MLCSVVLFIPSLYMPLCYASPSCGWFSRVVSAPPWIVCMYLFFFLGKEILFIAVMGLGGGFYSLRLPCGARVLELKKTKGTGDLWSVAQ